LLGVFARVPGLEDSGRSFKEGEIKLRPESSLYREAPSVYRWIYLAGNALCMEWGRVGAAPWRSSYKTKR
jgi:hypothetical protein